MVHAVISNPQCPTSVKTLHFVCNVHISQKSRFYLRMTTWKRPKNSTIIFTEQRLAWSIFSLFSKTNLSCRSLFPLGFINYLCLYQSLLLSYFSVSLRRTKKHFFQDFFLPQFSSTLIAAPAFYFSPCLGLLFCIYLFFAPD